MAQNVSTVLLARAVVTKGRDLEDLAQGCGFVSGAHSTRPPTLPQQAASRRWSPRGIADPRPVLCSQMPAYRQSTQAP
jgi:hypothetical protein